MFKFFDSKSQAIILRGSNLPHWTQSGATYFITFRTRDSIPQSVLEEWRRDIKGRYRTFKNSNGKYWNKWSANLPEALKREYLSLQKGRYFKLLDAHHGECLLRQSNISQMVAETLFYDLSQNF